MLIPPAAFVLWTILTKSTAFDAVAPESLSDGLRVLIGAGGAIVLGVIASVLGIHLNKANPPE